MISLAAWPRPTRRCGPGWRPKLLSGYSSPLHGRSVESGVSSRLSRPAASRVMAGASSSMPPPTAPEAALGLAAFRGKDTASFSEEWAEGAVLSAGRRNSTQRPGGWAGASGGEVADPASMGSGPAEGPVRRTLAEWASDRRRWS
eukprot:CAMPEP_0175318486 /NCGR_PEP_ID=MMETSP0093-20121207/70458_1 /TAXON_ID=311494 /ORGANISM="Alexandrium monilatum, Strain CCMP3105" /LENGTH=144 /DNA_ID=CAMNT_0016615293 /DNA_START=13 /DNA_END=443 /DNA_ORIENTATION=-